MSDSFECFRCGHLAVPLGYFLFAPLAHFSLSCLDFSLQPSFPWWILNHMIALALAVAKYSILRITVTEMYTCSLVSMMVATGIHTSCLTVLYRKCEWCGTYALTKKTGGHTSFLQPNLISMLSLC